MTTGRGAAGSRGSARVCRTWRCPGEHSAESLSIDSTASRKWSLWRSRAGGRGGSGPGFPCKPHWGLLDSRKHSWVPPGALPPLRREPGPETACFPEALAAATRSAGLSGGELSPVTMVWLFQDGGRVWGRSDLPTGPSWEALVLHSTDYRDIQLTPALLGTLLAAGRGMVLPSSARGSRGHSQHLSAGMT